MIDVTTLEPQRYIPMFGLSGLGFQLQGMLRSIFWSRAIGLIVHADI